MKHDTCTTFNYHEDEIEAHYVEVEDGREDIWRTPFVEETQNLGGPFRRRGNDFGRFLFCPMSYGIWLGKKEGPPKEKTVLEARP